MSFYVNLQLYIIQGYGPTTLIAEIYFQGLQLRWTAEYEFYYLKVIKRVYSCIFTSSQILGKAVWQQLIIWQAFLPYNRHE